MISTIHSEDPLVETTDNFLTDEECAHFINISKNNLERAKVSYEKEGKLSNGRTGYNTWLDHNHDNITYKIGQKIANKVGLPLENAEKFQIIYYDKNQEYKQHYDSWDHNNSEKTLRCMKYGGARLKTALCYLNTVKKGGGTKMTKLNITIEPDKGKLLIFQNTLSNDNNIRHPLSEHAGLPVDEGEKYAFNLWFKECNSKMLYKDFNPNYYLKHQNNFNNLKNICELSSNKVQHIDSIVKKDICDKLLKLCSFNNNNRKDAWVKLNNICELTKQFELLININREYFENINVVEYTPNKLHNKHYNAYDLNSEVGKKYTKTLGQRIYTISLALTDKIEINFPTINKKYILNQGDVLLYSNVNENTVIRNQSLERTIINNNSNNGFLANIYVREKTKDGKMIKLYQEKIEENYINTLNEVLELFKQDKIKTTWHGLNSFKYNFKGDFDYFKKIICSYNNIRLNGSCLNLENLNIDYKLDEKLPIQIIINVLNKDFLGLLQDYYKTTIKNDTWVLGDKQSNRYKAHNEPMSRFLHYEILPLIEKIVGKSMKPTYTYLSAYIKGAELPPHTDRPDCEYTVSFIVDKPIGSNWNIYVHREQQPIKHKGRYEIKPPLEECEAVDCDAGGLMLFQGTDHIHFREELQEDYYNILLLHYCSV